jgi:hypothetical protein
MADCGGFQRSLAACISQHCIADMGRALQHSALLAAAFSNAAKQL